MGRKKGTKKKSQVQRIEQRFAKQPRRTYTVLQCKQCRSASHYANWHPKWYTQLFIAVPTAHSRFEAVFLNSKLND